jgi:hypothetical protein
MQNGKVKTVQKIKLLIINNYTPWGRNSIKKWAQICDNGILLKWRTPWTLYIVVIN